MKKYDYEALRKRLLSDPEYLEESRITFDPNKPPPGWKINNPNWPSGEGEYLVRDEDDEVPLTP